jgi:hypothetical protein
MQAGEADDTDIVLLADAALGHLDAAENGANDAEVPDNSGEVRA